MKRIATVILICVFIIGCFVVPSFADDLSIELPLVPVVSSTSSLDTSTWLFYGQYGNASWYVATPVDTPKYFFYYEHSPYYGGCVACDSSLINTDKVCTARSSSGAYSSGTPNTLNEDYDLYVNAFTPGSGPTVTNPDIPVFSSLEEGLSYVRQYIDNGGISGSILPVPTDVSSNTDFQNMLLYQSSSDKYVYSVNSNLACAYFDYNNGSVDLRVCSLEPLNPNGFFNANGSGVVTILPINATFEGSGVYHGGVLVDGSLNPDIKVYTDESTFNSEMYEYLSSLNPPAPPVPSYTKNANVDAFLANTLISMGIKFESAADALSVGAAVWNYCIDENNLTDGDRLNKHDWDIDAFVNIVNAHSNFYLNWYKGYKVNENVAVALSWYLYDNFESSAGLSQPRAGTLSGVSVTRDAQYGYKGITNAATNYNMQSSYTFYSSSTLTYVNGSFVSETNIINGSQFLYEPSEVRRFIAFPPASVDDTSPDPNATGTLTNGDTTYDIDIQFPSLDWLEDLIIAFINALTNLFTTIADFLSQILDAILGLFGDAFEGLEEFGQGIVDWISVLFTGLSSLISRYLPSDISAIIIAFISLNIGVGLIKFVLGKV